MADARELLTSAQFITDGTTEIQGSEGKGRDLYGFNWGGGTFKAYTTQGLAPQLTLFDHAGLGVAVSGVTVGFQTTMTLASLALGTYYIAIGMYEISALSSGGNIFGSHNENTPTGLGSSGALSGWSSNASGAIGPYTIKFGDLVPAVVPVPATVFMFAPALLGFIGYRRKIKNLAV